LGERVVRNDEVGSSILLRSIGLAKHSPQVSNLLGKHLLVELYGCDRSRLDDAELLKALSVAASRAMGATVVDAHAHRYQPVGVSVVVILSESHLALHTWPERGMASIDIFVCSPAINPHEAKAFLAEDLSAAELAEMEIRRGDLQHERIPRWRHAKSTSSR
jgi:S-adenosylmethionine decarboxylase proenzyme